MLRVKPYFIYRLYIAKQESFHERRKYVSPPASTEFSKKYFTAGYLGTSHPSFIGLTHGK